MKLLALCLLLCLTSLTWAQEVPHVTIQTNLGMIEIELHPIKAPESVKNFLRYANEGFYNSTVFHRIIENFIVQGGGYDSNYQKKPTHSPIFNEATNGLSNTRGTVALARTADPHSATSQFFFNIKDNQFLDYKSSTASGWGYCVFGKVVEGMDVVDKISKLPVDADGPFRRDVPQNPVLIEEVRVEYTPPSNWVISTSKLPDKKPQDYIPSPADIQQDMLTDVDEETETGEDSSQVDDDEGNNLEEDNTDNVDQADQQAEEDEADNVDQADQQAEEDESNNVDQADQQAEGDEANNVDQADQQAEEESDSAQEDLTEDQEGTEEASNSTAEEPSTEDKNDLEDNEKLAETDSLEDGQEESQQGEETGAEESGDTDWEQDGSQEADAEDSSEEAMADASQVTDDQEQVAENSPESEVSSDADDTQAEETVPPSKSTSIAASLKATQATTILPDKTAPQTPPDEPTPPDSPAKRPN